MPAATSRPMAPRESCLGRTEALALERGECSPEELTAHVQHAEHCSACGIVFGRVVDLVVSSLGQPVVGR